MIEPLENADRFNMTADNYTSENGYEQYLTSGQLVTSDGENLSLVHIRDITMERRAIFSSRRKKPYMRHIPALK